MALIQVSRLVVASCLLFAVGCAAPQTEVAPKTPPAAELVVETPKDQIDRGRLEAVLRSGPPWVLRRVPIEEVIEAGKFVGWRVQELPNAWGDIELQPGDVVTMVNSMPLKTPTDFWAAWTTLSVASELKVAYLRDGEPREMAMAIFGNPNPAVADSLKQQPGAPESQPSELDGNQRYNQPKQGKTITIEDNSKPLSTTVVDWSE